MNLGDQKAATRYRSALGLALRWLFGIAVLLLVLNGLDWSELSSNLSEIRWGFILLAMSSFALSLLLKVVRWRWLLRDLAPQLGWLAIARAMFLGQAVNIIGVGHLGEAARVYWLKREEKISLVGTTSTVIAEKSLNLMFLGLVAGGWLTFIYKSPDLGGIRLSVVTGATLLVGVALFALYGSSVLAWAKRRLSKGDSKVHKWIVARIDTLSLGLSGIGSRPRFLRSMALSGIIWAVMILTDLLLLGALRLPMAIPLAISVVLWGHIGVAARLTPANIGTHHAAITFGLMLVGIERGEAFSYAVILHAMVTLLPLLIALILHGGKFPEPLNEERDLVQASL